MAKDTDNYKGHETSAGLEFLMTYGFAIVIVLMAIGALAYFGVLSAPLQDCSCKQSCVLTADAGVNEVTCCINATKQDKTCVYEMQKSTLSTMAYQTMVPLK
jgi:hypothetical protein